MHDILVRAICFVAIIAMGYILKKIGFMHQEDFKVISKIVVKLTLTATIIVNFSGKNLDLSMFIMTAIGLTFGILMLVIGFFQAKKKGREEQAFAMLNSAGCNVGNFVVPFAQSFLSSTSIIAISLFDVGNSIITLGGAVSAAKTVVNGNEKFSVTFLLKTIFTSVPLVTYLVMTVFALVHFNLPEPVISYADIIADANAFLAMFMIGVGFNISADLGKLKSIFKIIGIRYLVSIILAVVSYFVLPLPLEMKQPLVILFLSPIPSCAPAFTEEIGGDYGLASAINSLSIIISIVFITASLALMIN